MSISLNDPLSSPGANALFRRSPPEELLGDVSMATMVGLLNQLGQLSTVAADLFDSLGEEVARSSEQLGTLRGRLVGVTERLAQVDDALSAAPPEETTELCDAGTGLDYRAAPAEGSGHLFSAASRPPWVVAALERARPPPALQRLDALAPPPAEEDVHLREIYAACGISPSCADGFSDPHFFHKQWIAEEEARRRRLLDERKARRAARRSARPAQVGSASVDRKAKRVQRKKFMTFEEQMGLPAAGAASFSRGGAAPPPQQPPPPPPRSRDGDGDVDWDNLVCLVCKRKLKSAAVLAKHVAESELHKQNVAARDAQRRPHDDGRTNGRGFSEAAPERRR